MRRPLGASVVQQTRILVTVVQVELLRTAFAAAVRAAYEAGVGVPPALEAPTRALARAEHDAGVPVEKMIIEIKELLRTQTSDHALVFIPRVVGWAVSGYFAGSPRREPK